MERWLSDTEKNNTCPEKNLSQYYVVHKSHIDGPGVVAVENQTNLITNVADIFFCF
jgi:hypothetical protein